MIGKAINPQKIKEGVIWIVDDISERMQKDLELKKYQEHLEDIVKERTFNVIKTNEKLEQEIDDRSARKGVRATILFLSNRKDKGRNMSSYKTRVHIL